MNNTNSSIQLGALGAMRASDSADHATNGTWSQDAWDFFTKWAKNQNGKQFLGEDVRIASLGEINQPPEPRAWGAIILRAARTKVISRVGYSSTKDPRSHGNPKSVWVWIG